MQEKCLEEDADYCSWELQKIEKKLGSLARMYEIDKYKLHVVEIGKIIKLILGLKYRLSSVEAALDNLIWDSIDERYALERKRDKLLDQLEEAKILWHCIEKRTDVITGYVEHYLTGADVVHFQQLVKMKVNTCVEMKKIQQEISELSWNIKNDQSLIL